MDLLRRGMDLKPGGLADTEGTANPTKDSGDLFEAGLLSSNVFAEEKVGDEPFEHNRNLRQFVFGLWIL